ncbi:MAG: DUF1801 domain-containing protein [Anaerolineaceae bacterium]|jgi:hypothetical protein|nr:DUF1801 domain-containing protein [Anaerolineaceae bacterium]
MVSSSALTPQEYLLSLPAERRTVIAAVRDLILANLPPGYVETMNWGMLSYEIPLSTYPNTYNGQPLSFAGLAAQKNNYALYLMVVYANPVLLQRLQDAYTRADKKLDMGKSCIRFKKLEDLIQPVIAEIIAAVPVPKYIEVYEKSRIK